MNLKDISPSRTTNKLNKVMESRFGFTIDYSKLNLAKATRLSRSVSENITRFRKSVGAHTAEQNPKYMELLMMRESLNQWISENRQLMEGEMGKSEAILAAKDMVDSIQDMLEKVSKMQVEQMPALIDTIRDQIGNEQADAFKNSVGQLLAGMLDSMTQAREQADGAARQLAGEQMAPTGMSMGGAAPAMGGDEMAGMAAGEVPGGEVPTSDMDSFGASDAAAGGPEAMGREKR
jgi:hypothetical protein